MRIRFHYDLLLKSIDVDSMLPLLNAGDVISHVEMNDIRSEDTTLKQVQHLLCLVTLKSHEDFERFLDALDLSGRVRVSARLIDNSAFGIYIIYIVLLFILLFFYYV